MHVPTRRRIWLVCAAIAATAILAPLTARVASEHYHSDNLWRNALASLGGTQKPGDFGYVFLPAGDAVLDGRPLYMNADDYHGPPQAPYAYPPVLALLMAPVAALPERAARTYVPGVLFSLGLIAAVIGSLLLLGVRDWRCYPVALLYPVTIETIEYGAIGPVLLVLIALMWRYRDRTWLAAGAVGGGVVLKLFLWPLVAWLVVTRRLVAAWRSVALAVLLALVSWAVIGFGGFLEYPKLLRRLVDVEGENSYSAFALLRAIGLSDPASRAVTAAAGLALLGLAWRAAQSSDSRLDTDRRSLILALAAALVLTPILWLHYLVLLVVPLALTRPRLSPLWFVPLTLTVFEALDWYRGWPSGDEKALVSVALVAAAVFVGALKGGRVTVRDREPAPLKAT